MYSIIPFTSFTPSVDAAGRLRAAAYGSLVTPHFCFNLVMEIYSSHLQSFSYGRTGGSLPAGNAGAGFFYSWFAFAAPAPS